MVRPLRGRLAGEGWAPEEGQFSRWRCTAKPRLDAEPSQRDVGDWRSFFNQGSAEVLSVTPRSPSMGCGFSRGLAACGHIAEGDGGLLSCCGSILFAPSEATSAAISRCVGQSREIKDESVRASIKDHLLSPL